MIFNQYEYQPTKLSIIQRRANVVANDIGTNEVEKNGHRVHFSVGYIFVSKLSNSMLYGDLTNIEFYEIKEKVRRFVKVRIVFKKS